MSTGQPYRLERDARVARSRVLNFTFNGQKLTGLEGDTLASALLANGIRLVGRSFKLRRPRGIMAAGAEEANAIMQIGSGDRAIPNPRATQVQLFEGLEARTTKGWPSVKFDLGAINDTVSGVLSAGFYYKTFMYPRRFWDLYERVIRAMAGFGIAPDEADPDEYEQQNIHCDVLVVGAGPSGLMAALSAARSGARVLIADEQNEFGGSLLSAAPGADGDLSGAWLAAQIAELESLENVRILPRTTAFGYFDHNFLTLAERCHDHLPVMQRSGVRERLWRVRAGQVVLAQGAFERPLAFGNNDRPGVMLASAVSTYLNRYAVKAGDLPGSLNSLSSLERILCWIHRSAVARWRTRPRP
ncbi:MAG: 2Fe-2S iron-sulfur cluster-binding protein [Pseudomonadales bacterium]